MAKSERRLKSEAKGEVAALKKQLAEMAQSEFGLIAKQNHALAKAQS